MFYFGKCFTLEEVHLLQKLLKTKLSLSTVLKKRYSSKKILIGYRLGFSQKANLNCLVAKIQPHMHTKMLYKLNVLEKTQEASNFKTFLVC
jgi:hypothetical protein